MCAVKSRWSGHGNFSNWSKRKCGNSEEKVEVGSSCSGLQHNFEVMI